MFQEVQLEGLVDATMQEYCALTYTYTWVSVFTLLSLLQKLVFLKQFFNNSYFQKQLLDRFSLTAELEYINQQPNS